MGTQERVWLAVGILVIDIAIFFIPVLALIAGYIVLKRPAWFLNWAKRLYA